MFLSDKDILKYVGLRKITIEPFNINNLQNNSYLLTSDETVEIKHLQHVNVWTKERVCLPNDIIGLLTARSSISRQGLFFATSIGVDAGFKGNLVIEFFNMSPNTFKLTRGDKMVHILFAQTTGPCKPYMGKYVNQKPGSLLRDV